jgi:protein SCO1/2
MNKLLLLFFISISILFYTSCKEKLPLNKDLTKKSYLLLNQDSVEVKFPEIIAGNITVMGFIFTNCPDICPMTTHNMYLTEMRLKETGINDVKYVALSFDPERDKPSVLKKFAEFRGIDFNDWIMLTGEKIIITDLLRRFDVRAIPADSIYSDNGELSYSIMHTDRIALIDNKGAFQ